MHTKNTEVLLVFLITLKSSDTVALLLQSTEILHAQFHLQSAYASIEACTKHFDHTKQNVEEFLEQKEIPVKSEDSIFLNLSRNCLRSHTHDCMFYFLHLFRNMMLEYILCIL